MRWRFYPLAITARRGLLDNGTEAFPARFLSLQQAKAERICEKRREAAE